MTAPTPRIYVSLERSLELIEPNGLELNRHQLERGTHEMRRIPNPRIFGGETWLVRADAFDNGRIIGAPEADFRAWEIGAVSDVPGLCNYLRPVDWGVLAIRIIEA